MDDLKSPIRPLPAELSIDELKQSPECLKLYGRYTTLRKEGAQWTGLCPLHVEKSGSFKVRLYQGAYLWSCHGCNQSGGNIFAFIQAKEGVSFKEAVNRVRAEFGGNNWSEMSAQVDSTFRPAAPAEDKPLKTFTLVEWSRLEAALEASPAAQTWLREARGIGMETARKLRLGFKQDVGRLAGPKNESIAASGWVAFPCIDGDKVVGIKYRSIAAKAFCRQPGMATALFNLPTVDCFEPLYVTEGEFDAAAIEQAGFRAVSLPSASTTLTPEMKDQLMAAAQVILAGDCDGGVGSKVMERLWRDLGERTFLLHWPEGVKDANQTFLETAKADVNAFRELVEQLTAQARSQPMPDVYSLPEVMLSSNQVSLKDHPERLRFPWESVDKMAILLPGSVLSLIATQTGMGKSCLVNEVCLHGARKHNEVVLNYQCELSTDELATMNAANILRKNRNHLQKSDLEQAAMRIRGLPYYIGNNPSLTTVDGVLDLLEAAIRRLSATVVVLDHLHFICRNEDNEVQAQANAMARIKRMAQKHRVKFIVVGQPRKANQQNKGKRVHITDGKGSESFGSDCDAFMILHRDLVKDIDPANPPSDPYEAKTEIHLAKSRSKGEGAALATLMFAGEFAAFHEIDYRYSEENAA